MSGVTAELQGNLDKSAQSLESSGAKSEMTVREFIGWEALQQALTDDQLESRWEELLAGDETASFFQTPLWCLTWYRCYQNEYEPIVLTMWSGTQLRGLAPCAQLKPSGQLVFAGSGMADYRDVVTAWSDRAIFLDLIIPRMQAHAGGHPIAFGHTQPQSPTTALVEAWAQRVSGHGAIRIWHPCWRFIYGTNSESEIAELCRKKTIRQAFAHYKHVSGVTLHLIDTMAEWESLQHPYFTQHCLRQAGSGREESFEDVRKQQLYAQLFASRNPAIHFSCLWNGSKPVAFAFCFSYRQVLYYGAPSFDILESKHSPGMLHIIELVKRCHWEDYVEVDLTLGSSPFKGRVGNRCLQLPTVYLYPSRTKYWTVLGLQQVKASTRVILETLAPGCNLWEQLKTFLDRVAWYRNRFGQATWRSIGHYVRVKLSNFFYWNYLADIYVLTQDRLARVTPSIESTTPMEFHTNQPGDFLTLQGRERRDVAYYIQEAAKEINQGRTLHTVLVGGELANFGWSYRPTGVVHLPETESQFTVPERAVSLYSFYTCEKFRRKHFYTANLANIAQQRFTEGASKIFIVCERRNIGSSSVIQRVGFSSQTSHWLIRWGWWKRKGVVLRPDSLKNADG
jgi:CelD/BcsL family acetyltransferase involved in cellulose biosynthesis